MIHDDIDLYNTIAQVSITFSDSTEDVIDYYPNITESDRNAGIIQRYFVSRIPTEIIEVNYSTYDRLHANLLYNKISLFWKISGKLEDEITNIDGNSVKTYVGVLTANRLSVEDAEELMPGIRYKLMDYKQFWK